MQKVVRLGKIIVIDTVGGLLIMGGLLFGWLPGPGGIPMILAGLGLLAINHTWARRWLTWLKVNGSRLIDKLFPDQTIIKTAYDILGVALLVLAYYLIDSYSRNFVRSLAVIALFTALGIFLMNRKRLRSITNWVRHRKS